LLFRAYYGIPQILSSSNRPIGALYGFIKSLIFLIKRFDRRKAGMGLAVALDVGRGENFRYEIYQNYKNNRSPTPEDLVAQLKLTKPLLDAFGIVHLSDATCEADDVIASYSKEAAKNGYEVVVVSSDKDLMQLISDKISFFDIRKKSFCSVEEVYEKFAVLPEQICDYLALVGDRADNIPGIRGVGKKMASDLLKTYQNLDGIYANLPNIQDNKVKKLLENGYDLAILSKKLVMLRDIEITQSFETMHWNGFETYASTIERFLQDHSLDNLINLFK